MITQLMVTRCCEPEIARPIVMLGVPAHGLTKWMQTLTLVVLTHTRSGSTGPARQSQRLEIKSWKVVLVNVVSAGVRQRAAHYTRQGQVLELEVLDVFLMHPVAAGVHL